MTLSDTTPSATPMPLQQLLDALPRAHAPARPDGAAGACEIRGIREDSRQVRPGDLFLAVRGAATDGHDYITAAVARGAVAVLAEHPVVAPVPVVVVPQLRAARGALAAHFHRQPGRALNCIGVTGTNGKTSIAHCLADLAGRLGHPAGYLGTIGWGRVGALQPARLTTEDPVTVQARLAALRDDGCEWVVLEASSHALAQQRISDVPFRVAVFSNLTRDHLDYHADAEAYGAAKARLFRWPGLETAVVNVADPFGAQLLRDLASGVVALTYGATEGDIRWSGLRFADGRALGRWHTPWGTAALDLPVQAPFSVANLAAVLAVLCHAGTSLDDFVAAARDLAPVPGRMERFTTAAGAAVVVDFAHTPDALAQVLDALRAGTPGRLICVVGCGGDRDRGKRPQMAAAAEARADVLWLTSDNPRSEPPAAIIAEMRAGLRGRICARDCVDRAEAIRGAIADAAGGDTVLVAGKGHEDYQEIAGQRLPFSDRALVAGLLGGRT